MSPPEREKPGPPQTRHSPKGTNADKSTAPARYTGPPTPVWVPCTRPQPPQHPGTQLRRRRGASHRLQQLDSGVCDPWRYEPPTGGYPEAAAHLLAHGLTPAPNAAALREMWKAGGDERAAAQTVRERWAGSS